MPLQSQSPKLAPLPCKRICTVEIPGLTATFSGTELRGLKSMQGEKGKEVQIPQKVEASRVHQGMLLAGSLGPA